MVKKILLFLLILVSFKDTAYAVNFSQKMDVKIGVFDAAVVELEYDETDNHYEISADVKTDNFFASVYPFIGKYKSIGLIEKDELLPKVYETYTKSRNHTRTKKIFYDESGKAYKRISTKDDRRNEVEIKNVPKTADVADLQSVFAELISNFQQNKTCILEREVYDGKKHYKVIAKDEGSETRYFEFFRRNEPSYKCVVYIENLKENNDNILWDVSADKPINLWIGWDIKTKMPFVLEISIDSTPLGALKVTPNTLKIK